MRATTRKERQQEHECETKAGCHQHVPLSGVRQGHRAGPIYHSGSPPNALKLKRGGREGKGTAARQAAASEPQLCGGRMAGPLSLAALSLGAL